VLRSVVSLPVVVIGQSSSMFRFYLFYLFSYLLLIHHKERQYNGILLICFSGLYSVYKLELNKTFCVSLYLFDTAYT